MIVLALFFESKEHTDTNTAVSHWMVTISPHCLLLWIILELCLHVCYLQQYLPPFYGKKCEKGGFLFYSLLNRLFILFYFIFCLSVCLFEFGVFASGKLFLWMLWSCFVHARTFQIHVKACLQPVSPFRCPVHSHTQSAHVSLIA